MKKINKELLSNIVILYVEDEKSIREEIAYFFNKYVKEIHLASDGLEGLKKFEEVNPDVVITDIQMPNMNGLEMIEKLKIKDIPVIITTAYSDIEYFLKAIELGVNKFAIKPIDLADLTYNVQECVLNRRIQDKLLEKENLLKIVDENVFVSITDEKGIIVDVSKAFCELTGFLKEELITNTHNLIKSENTTDEFYKNLWDTITSGKIFYEEIQNKKKDGDFFWSKLKITPVFHEDKIINYIAIRQDITNKKKLQQLAIEDDLTKLYNRRYFNEILNREIRRTKRDKATLSLLAFDVDYFKKYNDTYGHPEGDKILIIIANILKKSSLRASDYAFRIGGEEFAIVFSNLTIEESLTYAKDIVKKVEDLKIEHKTSGTSNYITISAGLIVQSFVYLEDLETLYKYADEALYKAKVEGRNQVFLSKESK